ncbi:hypothetical protein SCLCIDRAFT_1043635 [Scleroderma citrinum Foug A]|uniref:Uncharacterized protein n=1 Tax=Scleroderma citrinum Foug A TaxID=1036808 RepID=A0A0C3DSA4_9AGAM|nr:hypothetical protein SCLCIDRAFT_1043635 [Scleroderma citrinum Foug A]
MNVDVLQVLLSTWWRLMQPDSKISRIVVFGSYLVPIRSSSRSSLSWSVCIRRSRNHPIKHGGRQDPQGDAGETDEKS